jgi:hypothetical protein
MAQSDSGIGNVTPNAELVQMAMSYSRSYMLCAAARLEIADALGDEVRSVDHLAETCQADVDALYRLLLALASIGITEEMTPKHFRLTPFGRPLRREGTASRLGTPTNFGQTNPPPDRKARNGSSGGCGPTPTSQWTYRAEQPALTARHEATSTVMVTRRAEGSALGTHARPLRRADQRSADRTRDPAPVGRSRGRYPPGRDLTL